jgi:hypothetical protein
MNEVEQAPAKAPEKTPEELEREEFEQRLRELDAHEVERKKEIRFQLFRLVEKFGLRMEELNQWKKDNPLGIELTWITGKPFIYRNLSLGEYEQAAEGVQDTAALHRKVAARSILWPNMFPQESDFLRGPAGIAATLAEAVLRTSGFEQVITVSL